MKCDLQNGEKRSCKQTRNLNNAPCWKQNFKNSLGSYMGGVFSLSQCCFLLKAFHFFFEFFTSFSWRLGCGRILPWLVFAVGDAWTPSHFVITFSAQQIYPFPLSNKFAFSAGGSTISAFVTKQNLIFSVRSARFSLPPRPTIEEEKVFSPSKHLLPLLFPPFWKKTLAEHVLFLNKTIEQVIKQR